MKKKLHYFDGLGATIFCVVVYISFGSYLLFYELPRDLVDDLIGTIAIIIMIPVLLGLSIYFILLAAIPAMNYVVTEDGIYVRKINKIRYFLSWSEVESIGVYPVGVVVSRIGPYETKQKLDPENRNGPESVFWRFEKDYINSACYTKKRLQYADNCPILVVTQALSRGQLEKRYLNMMYLWTNWKKKNGNNPEMRTSGSAFTEDTEKGHDRETVHEKTPEGGARKSENKEILKICAIVGMLLTILTLVALAGYAYLQVSLTMAVTAVLILFVICYILCMAVPDYFSAIISSKDSAEYSNGTKAVSLFVPMLASGGGLTLILRHSICYQSIIQAGIVMGILCIVLAGLLFLRCKKPKKNFLTLLMCIFVTCFAAVGIINAANLMLDTDPIEETECIITYVSEDDGLIEVNYNDKPYDIHYDAEDGGRFAEGDTVTVYRYRGGIGLPTLDIYTTTTDNATAMTAAAI